MRKAVDVDEHDAAKPAVMKRLFGIALMVALPVWGQGSHPEDAAFLAARDAYVKGERAALARALAGLKTHPLQPWGTYFQLQQRLEDGSDQEVAEFIERHEGGYLAEKLRADWVKWLARRNDWAGVRIQHARLQKPDTDARCRGLSARLHLGEPEVADEARALLAGTAPLTEPCHAPLDRLADSGKLGPDSLWERLRWLWATNKLKEARTVAGWLPRKEQPAGRMVDSVIEHPARHLAKLPERFAEHRSERELAGLAAMRMARTDARSAAARWQEIEARFPPAERGFVWGQIAYWAAFNHLPEAGAWFEQAEKLGGALDEEQRAWRVRAALRAGEWLGVQRAVAAMPESQATLPEWVYWRGRALAALDQHEAARLQYVRIADQPGFYGILATEALGRAFTLPPRAIAPSDEEMSTAATTPGLARALALIRLDLRIEGVREWNWSLGGLSDRQLIAAAELARRHEVIDRSISAADRTRAEHDYSLRYPAPFQRLVEPRVREVGLDLAWVYGLMRQESRFIMDAKSSAGAKGLMQLMPATAKWVAKKIGMAHYQPAKVTDMQTNVTLGTHYMRMVMEDLDQHPVLASAAYNAGPGRARKWRAERSLEGAIYAETIPFTETRDYVKKVMANAIPYAALFGATAPSLTARLGVIRPRGFGDGTAEDLP